MNELSMRLGNGSLYGFLELRSIQKLGNRCLNVRIILRNGCKIHREMST